MSVLHKKSARLRDEERARLIWLLSTDKAVTSALLGKLTLAERYDEGTLADDLAEVEMLVSHLPPPDLADALEALPYDARTALWCLVPDDKRGEVLLEASENVWGDLIDKMSDPELLQAMQPLDIDEQVYLLQHLPRNLTGRLLATLPAEKRARIRQIMRYADNSVGSIMEFEVITVRPEATLAAVQRYLRRLGKMPENTDKLFVTTRNKLLLGELELQTILLNDAQKRVGEVMEGDPVTFQPHEEAEKVARTFERDDLLSAAVIDADGKLIGREHFYLRVARGDTKAQVLSSFMKQFYAGTPFVPREIMLQTDIEDREVIEQWLTGRRGSRVYLRVPKIGSKEKLVELAARNAELILSKDKERIRREEGRTIGAVKEIASLLSLSNISRMEAYDISNISGFANVGSMVVFEKGKPKRSDYRKFKIKSVSGPDDYACMREVLTRRFTHGIEEREELEGTAEKKEAGSFTKFPDVIMMDGGRGQVNIALAVLQELKLSIPVCGMVKDDNHRTRGLYFNNEEIPIDRNSEGFKLITRIQDEAHRFAIEYHRSLRGKAQVKSVLDEIPGVGPARRKALMRGFKSIEEIREADVETLLQVEGMNRPAAQGIYDFFHQKK